MGVVSKSMQKDRRTKDNNYEKIGKLSIVGVGMRSHSGVAAKMFDVLANTGVNIQMISTSEIKISVVIDLDQAEEATQAVHDAFLG